MEEEIKQLQDEVLELQRLKQDHEELKEKFEKMFFSDKTNFNRSIAWGDGNNMVLGTTAGTKIGTATDQLLGFYNATPVNQPATVTDPSVSTVTDNTETTNNTTINNNFTSLDNKVEDIIDRLQELGLVA